MRYCTRCVLPDTRPGLRLDADGVCNACRAHKARSQIDWDARRADFERIVVAARRRSRGYDCVVPVSGGKDSTWQVVTCLAHGLNPLAVTWKTPARTEIGAANLANLVELGVDHIDYQVNPKVERPFALRSFERHGTPAIPMHMALFAIPLTIAARFEIPLVVWGENSAVEYGGGDAAFEGYVLDRAWLERFGVTHGTTAADWVSDELPARALTPYFAPSDDELARSGVLALFLGHFFAWDPAQTVQVACAHGFRPAAKPRTGVYDYADIDDDFISIHHWLKWLKFGFTRSFDNLALEIRNGRVTREEAIDVLRSRGDETPQADIDRFCSYVGIDRPRFFEIAERFRNLEIWRRRDSVWTIDGFIVEGWSWR